jgi:hypothetical protein
MIQRTRLHIVRMLYENYKLCHVVLVPHDFLLFLKKQKINSTGDISRWDVRNVQFTSYMFREASAFNIDLNSWELRLVAIK